MIESKEQEEYKFLGYLAIYIIILFTLNIWVLFGLGGFEEQIYQQKTFLYLSPLLLILISSVVFTILRHKFPNSKWANLTTFGYDPEFTPLSKITIFKPIFKNFFLFIMATFLILMPLSFIGISQQSALFPKTATPSFGTEQQITKTSEVFFATEPASSSETGLLWLTLIVAFWLAFMLVKKLGTPKPLDKIVPIIFSLVVAVIFWMSLHLLRYSTTDYNLISVAFFGLMSAILMFGTGSIIPAIIYHQINNFLLKSLEIFSNQAFMIYLWAFYIIILIVFIWSYTKSLKSKKEAIEI